MATKTELYTLYKDDYLAWDVTESLTIVTKRHANDGGSITQEVTYCKAYPLRNARVVFGDVQVTGMETSYLIPHTLLPIINASGQEIKPNDLIIDSDEIEYTVQNARLVMFGTQWVILCVRRKSK